MNRNFSLAPVLLVLLAACGAPAPAATTPAAAPTAPEPPAPAAAPAIPPAVDEAMGRVQGLLADANDAAIKAAFSPTFLAAVPADKVRALFTAMHGELGACKERRAAQVKNETAALVRVQCERGAVNATIVVNAAPPHLIDGLLLKPAP